MNHNRPIPHFSYTKQHRVSTSNRCPRCDAPDWCVYSDDRTAVLCMRDKSGDVVREVESGEGRIYFLTDKLPDRPTFYKRPKKSPKPKKAADLNTRHEIYTALLSALSLSSAHQQNLQSRGLTDAEIKQLRYKTLPEGLDRAAPINTLKKDHPSEKLLTAPGFYQTPKGATWINGYPGILCPSRDIDGKIQGIQVRRDTKDENDQSNKYTWLSSASKDGPGSGVPVHVNQPEFHDSTHTDRIWITEGVIKADITALRLGEPVIGLAGIGSWSEKTLMPILDHFDRKHIVIAYDADKQRNKNVQYALTKLATFLSAKGYFVWIANWKLSDAKGIDDLLAKGLQPELTRYHPTPAIETLAHQPVTRIEKSNRTALPADEHPEELLESEIHTFLHTGFGALLVRATQGMGKTYLSTKLAHAQIPEIRPIYGAPRTELLDENLKDGWYKIRPRRPKTERGLTYPPARVLHHFNVMIKEVAERKGILDLNDIEVLCHHHNRADALGAKRWNVVKNLCQSCEIGGTVGIDACPYFMQYRQPDPLLTVHENLMIPNFAEQMFHQNPHFYQRQILILDEPNPLNFIERVDITTQDLSDAIVDAQSDELKALLSTVRTAVETAASEEKRHFGKTALGALIEAAGGAEAFIALLDGAEPEVNFANEEVTIEIDRFVNVTRKSYHVIVNGEERYIPQSIAEPVNDTQIRVKRNYALQNEFKIVSEVDPNTDDIPLNFQRDLLLVLRREIDFYLKDGRLAYDGTVGRSAEPYNSQLEILPFSSPTLKPAIRLNLQKRMDIPKDVPILALDGQGDSKLLSHLLGRDVREFKATQIPNAEIIQCIDAAYGITTLWNKTEQKPKSSLLRLYNRVVKPLAQKDPAKIVILTWKKIADWLRGKIESGELPASLAVEHYGNIEGSNAYAEREISIHIGTPNMDGRDIEAISHALYIDSEPIDITQTEVLAHYDYIDATGSGYAVRVKRYADYRVESIAKLFRENELIQAAHRTRAIRNENRQIYLLTNLPLEDLPPTQLLTINQLSAGLNAQAGSEKEKARQTFMDTIAETGQIASHQFAELLNFKVSRATIWRWTREFAKSLNLTRSRVTIDRTWFHIYHEAGIEPDIAPYALENEHAQIEVVDYPTDETEPDWHIQADSQKTSGTDPPVVTGKQRSLFFLPKLGEI